MKTTSIAILLVSLTLLPAPVQAENAIGFIEKFALADDRDAVLKELIAGTEEYYFYHALHFQHTGRKAEYAALMQQWMERQTTSALREEIIHRQNLKDYETDPEATLKWLKDKLHLTFDHQQLPRDPVPQYPDKLDAALISREAFWQRALANQDNIQQVKETAFSWILTENKKLTKGQRNELLQRLQRPDYPNLVALIREELGEEHSGGFGAYPIHAQLLLAQLDELLKTRPALLQSSAFVDAYLRKLLPGADTNMERDPAVKLAWFERVQAFVARLGPAFHSLKAHVLFHRLNFDRQQGQRDEARFLSYLKLPRAVDYFCESFTKRETFLNPADLSADFQKCTLCPAIQNEGELVRDYLLHFLKDAPNADGYREILADYFVLPLLAEAKLVNGLGDAEQWFSMMDAPAIAALRQRVDLDLDPANPKVFAPADPVALKIHVKNVPLLLVKLFEINTANFCESSIEEINTDINLDGLVAAVEKSYAYAEVPILRVPRVLEFPELEGKRGVWVVDLVGNGVASRAVIRKGTLHAISRVSAAGTAVTVLDEAWQPVPKAYAKLDTRRFDAGKNGEILIPFSAAPGGQSLILGNADGFCARCIVSIAGENYDASGSRFYVNHEALLPGNKATVLLRPQIQVFGTTISVKSLIEPMVSVRMADADGVESVSILPVKLEDGRDASFEIDVSDRVESISFMFNARVKSLTTGADVAVTASSGEMINSFNRSEFTADLHLSPLGGLWVVEHLGRTGEPLADKAVQVELFHRDFQIPITVMLKTSASGAIVLGELPGIEKIAASSGIRREWVLPRDTCVLPENIHAKVGEPVLIPWFGGNDASEVSLLEVIGGMSVRDAIEHAKLAPPYLVLEGLPAGDYRLSLPRQNLHCQLRITNGVRQKNYLLSKNRLLEQKAPPVLQISKAEVAGPDVVVTLTGAGKAARVHITASRFLQSPSAFHRLAWPLPEPAIGVPASTRSLFVSGRKLGDELRYVIDRRHAPKLPGNLLSRPGLLLNPWAINKTEMELEKVERGEMMMKQLQEAEPGEPMVVNSPAPADQLKAPPPAPQEPCHDFLASAVPSHFHLIPEANGTVRIPVESLGDRQFLEIVAVDLSSTTVRHVSLPARELKTLDLRLAHGLDPQAHFAEMNEITLLEKDQPLSIAANSRFDAQGHLGALFNYLVALNPNPEMENFRFLLEWPTFDEAKKREMYSRHACHELSFFLWRKDPAFFESVIKPYLSNKKDKTMMDHFLLGSDLTEYLRPWKYGRLNTLERILLARRVAPQRDSIHRDLKDLLSLIPPQPAIDNLRSDFGFVNGTLTLGGVASGRTAGVLDVNGGNFDNGVASLYDDKLAASGEPVESGAFGGGVAVQPRYKLGAEVEDMPALDRMEDFKKLEDGRWKADTDKGGKELNFAYQEQQLGESEADAFSVEEAGDARSNLRRLAVVDSKFSSTTGGVSLGDDDLAALNGDLTAELRDVEGMIMYRKQESTKEWAENNYWKLLIESQTAALIPVNAFWNDYALWDGASAFVSRNVIKLGSSHTEMLLALAVTDLPFPGGAGEVKVERGENGFTLTSPHACLVFHKALRPAPMQDKATTLLVSQNFYRQGDRYLEANGERQDKFVTGEFIAGAVYGCQIVVTNPSSSRQQLDVLTQIPQGSVGVLGMKRTRTVPLTLEPFHTQTLEYAFYFPTAGNFIHFPIHVAKAGATLAAAPPAAFKVVDTPTTLDTSSWFYISQYGTDAETLAFLEQNNLHALSLDLMNWRLKKLDFFNHVLKLLEARHVFHQTTYSYAAHHNQPAALGEFLLHQEDFLRQCGPAMDCALVQPDAVARHWYQHLEYSPLINARAHQLGKARAILNDRLFQHYNSLLNLLAHRAALTDEDRLAIAYYLLAQDRIGEGIGQFVRVNREKITGHLQYDYMGAVVAMYQGDAAAAKSLADPHADHAVDKWREKFAQVIAHVEEVGGKAPAKTDEEDREQALEVAAAKEPTLDFTVDGKSINLTYQNLTTASVNYYLMDLEFLFSGNPFLGDDSSRFRLIKATRTVELELPAGGRHSFALLPEFHGKNVLVEITAGGKSISRASYANNLDVQISENQGRLQVKHATDGKALSKVYVKVFAEQNGEIKFYKDGYTDLRGKFDYASLSTDQIDQATRFALLIASDEHGSVVREVQPPRQ